MAISKQTACFLKLLVTSVCFLMIFYISLGLHQFDSFRVVRQDIGTQKIKEHTSRYIVFGSTAAVVSETGIILQSHDTGGYSNITSMENNQTTYNDIHLEHRDGIVTAFKIDKQNINDEDVGNVHDGDDDIPHYSRRQRVEHIRRDNSSNGYFDLTTNVTEKVVPDSNPAQSSMDNGNNKESKIEDMSNAAEIKRDEALERAKPGSLGDGLKSRNQSGVKESDGESLKNRKSPPLIIVLAQWRFGSTIIGELFDQNPDLFYMFEPLWAANKIKNRRHLGQTTPEGRRVFRGVLRRFFTCNFNAEFVKIMDTPSWVGRPFNRAVCLEHSGCGLGNATSLQELCSRYQGRLATKVIRADLELLRPLVVEDGMNLKIIHLVRDPRAAAASRINYRLTMAKNKADTVKDLLPEQGYLEQLRLPFSHTCQWIRENVILHSGDLPAWLKGRYRLLRYEDFAEAPLNVTRDMYGFVGIPLPRRVEEWVTEHTHAHKSDRRTFAVRKDARSTAYRWVQELHELDVKRIEEECMDVIQLLGYEPYNELKGPS